MSYAILKNFCPVTFPSDDPVSYCTMNGLSNKFLHGSSGGEIGPYDIKCQAFMASRCAKQWDDVCEFASKDQERRYPNNLQYNKGENDIIQKNMSAGDFLVVNTAQAKYVSDRGNCPIKREVFDPTVVSSPLVEYDVSGCVKTYAVDPKTIDNDPVMNKILMRPEMAERLLLNIYNTMKRQGTLKDLKGTKLGNFFKVA